MRLRPRSLIVLAAVLWCSSAYVFTATQDAVPKYAAGGALVDSAISEVAGNVGIGSTSAVTLLEDGGSAAKAFIRTDRAGALSYGLEISNRSRRPMASVPASDLSAQPIG